MISKFKAHLNLEIKDILKPNFLTIERFVNSLHKNHLSKALTLNSKNVISQKNIGLNFDLFKTFLQLNYKR